MSFERNMFSWSCVVFFVCMLFGKLWYPVTPFGSYYFQCMPQKQVQGHLKKINSSFYRNGNRMKLRMFFQQIKLFLKEFRNCNSNWFLYLTKSYQIKPRAYRTVYIMLFFFSQDLAMDTRKKGISNLKCSQALSKMNTYIHISVSPFWMSQKFDFPGAGNVLLW